MSSTTPSPRQAPMEYKSIQELNCDDAIRRLLEARRLGDPRQIAAAEGAFRATMTVTKDIDPKVWEKNKIYLDGIHA
jgi:hypothetical protein